MERDFLVGFTSHSLSRILSMIASQRSFSFMTPSRTLYVEIYKADSYSIYVFIIAISSDTSYRVRSFFSIVVSCSSKDYYGSSDNATLLLLLEMAGECSLDDLTGDDDCSKLLTSSRMLGTPAAIMIYLSLQARLIKEGAAAAYLSVIVLT